MIFSIIVPVYKTEKYIKECVESLVTQDFTEDFEIILVDDGSPDICPQICDEYAKIYKNIVVVHKENGGLVSARKAGMNIAKGDYIVNVDSDDYILPNFLRTLDEEIKKNAPETICFGLRAFGMTSYNFNSKCTEGFYQGEALKQIKESYLYSNELVGLNSGKIAFNICGKCVKRDLYIESQNCVPNHVLSGEDTFFTLAWCTNVKSVSFLNYYGYMYRQNAESCEHDFKLDKIQQLNRTVSDMLCFSETKASAYSVNIKIYYTYRVAFYLTGIAQFSSSYNSFCNKFREISSKIQYEWMSGITEKMTTKAKLKSFLIRNHCLPYFYWLGKRNKG